MALDLTLSNRARASVSSDADSGYNDIINETHRKRVGSLCGSNVSPEPKLFATRESEFVHSAPVSPICTKTCSITLTPPPSRASSIHLAPPLIKASKLSPPRSANSISSLATSSYDGSNSDQESEKIDVTELSDFERMKLKQSESNEALHGKPPKLISDQAEKNSRKFNMESILASDDQKTRHRRKSNSNVPPPLKLTETTSTAIHQYRSKMSPYEYNSRRARVSPYDIITPNTPQRFNFDLRTLHSDLPVNSPLPISPYNLLSPTTKFNFMSASLPCSPQVPSMLPASPLIPSPRHPHSPDWAFVVPRSRLDSNSSIESHDMSRHMPFQPYTSVTSPRISAELAQTHTMRSPNVDGTAKRNDGRRVSHNRMQSHPYSQPTKESPVKSRLDHAEAVATIRRRIYSNIDIKSNNINKVHERSLIQRNLKKGSISPSDSQQNVITHSRSCISLHPGSASRMAARPYHLLPSSRSPSYPNLDRAADHTPSISLTVRDVENKLRLSQHVSHKESSQHYMSPGSSPVRHISVTTDSDEENRPPKGSSVGSPAISDDGNSGDDGGLSSDSLDLSSDHDEVFDQHPLPADPRNWSLGQVSEWLKMVATSHKLSYIDPARFPMNGRGLCLMTEKMFLDRVPSGGRLLYYDFRNRLNKVL